MSSTQASSTAPAQAARSSSSSRRRSSPSSELRASSCTTLRGLSGHTGPTSSSRCSPKERASRRTLLPGCGGRRGTTSALEAARAEADLIACAVYPIALTLHRVSGEALASALEERRNGSWCRPRHPLAGRRDRGRVHRRRPRDAARSAHRRAGRAARAAGRARRGDRHTASGARSQRPARRRPRGAGHDRGEAGSPPVAAPIRSDHSTSQAIVHVLSASRATRPSSTRLRALFDGRFGSPPGPIDATVRRRSRSSPRAWRRTGLPPISTRSAATQPVSPRAKKSSCSWHSSARRRSRCCKRSATARAARRACSARGRPNTGGLTFGRSSASSRETGIAEIAVEERYSRLRAAHRRSARAGCPGGTRSLGCRARHRRADDRRRGPHRSPDGRHVLPFVAARSAALRRGR